MIMPGMPNMPKIPGMSNINAPTRQLTMDLTGPKKVDANSKAQCAVPAGLKLGPKVDLTIDLPRPAKESEPIKPGKEEQGEKVEFKIKTYWGCSETVPPGQPKVIDSKDMTAAMKGNMVKSKEFKATMNRMIANADGSHAYWPGQKAKPIEKEATAPGSYELTTNYCGGTSIVFDKPQDFLAPIDLISPGSKIDLAKAIRVEWKPVPNALAYHLTAFSGDENELITWTSSLDPNSAPDLVSRALSKTELDTLLKNGVVIPAEKTFCYIPKGIFEATKSPMLMLTAIGADKLQDKDGIATQVVVRSTATAMLGSMGVDMEDESADDNQSSDGNALDKADEGMDKADDAESTVDDAKDLVNRAKNIFKRKK